MTLVGNPLPQNIGSNPIYGLTLAQLTAICATPAGVASLFQLLLAGNTVDVTSSTVTIPLAAVTALAPVAVVP